MNPSSNNQSPIRNPSLQQQQQQQSNNGPKGSDNIKQYYNQLVSNYRIVQQQLQQLSTLPTSPQVLDRKKFLLEQHELLQNAMQDLTNRFNQQQQQQSLPPQSPQTPKDISRLTISNPMLPSSNLTPPSPLIQLSDTAIPPPQQHHHQQPQQQQHQQPQQHQLPKNVKHTPQSPFVYNPQQQAPKLSFSIREFLQRNRIVGSSLVTPSAADFSANSDIARNISNHFKCNRQQPLKNSLFKQLRGKGDGRLVYLMTRKDSDSGGSGGDDIIIAPSAMKELFAISDRWVTEVCKEIAINRFHRSRSRDDTDDTDNDDDDISWQDVDLALRNVANHESNHRSFGPFYRRLSDHFSSPTITPSQTPSQTQQTQANNQHRQRLLQVRKIFEKS